MVCALLGDCVLPGPRVAGAWLGVVAGGTGICAGLAIAVEIQCRAGVDRRGGGTWRASRRPWLTPAAALCRNALLALAVFSPELIWNAAAPLGLVRLPGRAGRRLRSFHPLGPLDRVRAARHCSCCRGFGSDSSSRTHPRACGRDRWHGGHGCWVASPTGPILLFAAGGALVRPRAVSIGRCRAICSCCRCLGRGWRSGGRRGAGRSGRRSSSSRECSASAHRNAMELGRHCSLPAPDPAIQAIDWTPLRQALAARGLPGACSAGRSGLVHHRASWASPSGRCCAWTPTTGSSAIAAHRPMLIGHDVLIVAPRLPAGSLSRAVHINRNAAAGADGAARADRAGGAVSRA